MWYGLIHKLQAVLAAALIVFIAGCSSVADYEVGDVQTVSDSAVIDTELEYVMDSLGRGETVSIIVTLSDKADLPDPPTVRDRKKRAYLVRALKDKADTSQSRIRGMLHDRGVKEIAPLWIINGMALEADAAVIKELAVQPEIESIRLNALLDIVPEIPAAPSEPEQNLYAISTPYLWDMGFRGQHMVVANMDTGVDVQHPDLAGGWRGGSNSWFDPYGEHQDPYDPFGHGTQSMGIIVGGSAGGSAIGVAPDAQWIAAKIFDDNGVALLSAVHQAFQWLLDPDGDEQTDDAPDVVNSSWGFRDYVNECVSEFEDDVAALKAAGIAVVFSGGNGGPNASTSISPANYAGGFAAGAVNEELSIARFSGRGPSACTGSIYPHVVAPGVNIKTTDLTFGGAFPDSYAYVSGTSFAAAHVAGAMALLLNAFPQLTIDELESALKASATDLGIQGVDNDYGYGLIDVQDAHDFILNPSPCTDADRDGYFVEAACDIGPDCDDFDAAIHPDAREIRHDEIDQDCNGSDLTIDVVWARYFLMLNRLEVRAESDLMDGALLELVGFGPLAWNPETLQWEISVEDVEGYRSRITVRGNEGWMTVPVRMGR